MKFLKYSILLLFAGTSLNSCFTDNDDVITPSSDLEIKDFIWKGLNFWSLYKSDVDNLANDRFSSDQDYTSFLNDFSSPKDLFDNITSDRDRFSRLFSDYTIIEQALDGVTLNNGMEYGLVRYPDSESNVFGYVRYVLPNTDAAAKGIKRGDIFSTVDGTQITDTNFGDLLAPDSYTIGLASFDGNTVTPTNTSISLTKVQYTENPVFLSKTLDVGGNPVGYLMYNSFTSDFDPQLNTAFGEFSTDGITDLVLDLRYNGGGSIETAKDLSSMITGQFNGKTFSVEQYNEDRQQQYGNTRIFDNEIRTGVPINSLNLTRVYILTSDRTASASELVINSLKPYIEVIQIGTTTTGKFEGSFIVYDAPPPLFRRSEANLGHTYAMLPLVLKSANSAGISDYFDGLLPTIEIAEDFTNLGILGDPNEPLLKSALDKIAGSKTSNKYNKVPLEQIGDSNMSSPIYQKMFINLD